MKRFYTILLVAMLPLSCFAQKLDIGLGVKAGANFSQINGKYWENGYKANFLGGVFLAVNGKRLGGQIEGIFSQSTYNTGQGFYDIYHDFYNNVKDSAKQGSMQVNYLSIPVLLNIRLFSRAIIQLGPQYSGVVSVNDKDELLKDAKDLFKSGSLDGVVGLWIDLPARFNIGARYIFGLSNINKVDETTVSNGTTGQQIDDSWKQRTLQVHIGYSIM